MSTTLNEFQFELLPDLEAEAGQVFGIGADMSIDDEGFAPGDDEWEIEDEMNPRRGGINFGRDTLQGPTWAFDLHVNRLDIAGAIETLSSFRTAWRAQKIRQTPGAVLPLRYRLNDRYRRVYGRPRRLSAPPSNKIMSGYVPVTVDFQCADGFTYSDQEQSVQLSLQQGSAGGFVFPLVFPFTTLPVGTSQQQVVVGGDAPTFPIVTFTGPVTNPVLVTSTWTLGLDMTIEEGQTVELDLRPWAMTVMLNGTSSVAGKLGRRQYLAEMALEPGPTMLTFRGSSEVSSATCAVRWSDAWNSI